MGDFNWAVLESRCVYLNEVLLEVILAVLLAYFLIFGGLDSWESGEHRQVVSLRNMRVVIQRTQRIVLGILLLRLLLILVLLVSLCIRTRHWRQVVTHGHVVRKLRS